MTTTSDGGQGPQGAATQAAPGTYGRRPQGVRLPAETRLGPVRLAVVDLERSVAFYRDVLGFRRLGEAPPDGDGSSGPSSSAPPSAGVLLGPHGDDRTLLELRASDRTRPAPGRGRLGLYHVAYLLPDRAALGRLVGHLADRRVRLGAGDHYVSEAFYLSDPDGLGIEVYADRPRDTWRRAGDELVMGTDPVDVDDLLRAAGDEPWRGLPAGTCVGHVHLHVGAIDRARAFYRDVLGFDENVWSYPGAAFFGAGGYHHHVGTNTWAGPTATPPPDDEARLLAWTILVPHEGALEGVATSLASAGAPHERDDGAVVARDPWGTTVRIVVDAP